MWVVGCVLAGVDWLVGCMLCAYLYCTVLTAELCKENLLEINIILLPRFFIFFPLFSFFILFFHFLFFLFNFENDVKCYKFALEYYGMEVLSCSVWRGLCMVSFVFSSPVYFVSTTSA